MLYVVVRGENVPPEVHAYLSRRVKQGLAKARKEGRVGGRHGSGVSPKLVSKIVAMRERGMAYNKIAQSLNEDDVPTGQSAGVPPSDGGPEWHASTVRHLYLEAAE
jgi:hypothetical protein